MPAPANTDEFLDLVRKSGVVEEKRLLTYLDKLRTSSSLPLEPSKAAGLMVRDGILTHFQAEQVLQGKWRRFTIGKYKVLERLGAGGMGSVYLCEHKLMRRRVAVKVLPTAKADDPSSLERFYREARAVAALDHPNIVRAYDIDQDDKLHFLVMEYVDGASLQEIVKKVGPMDVLRVAHYMRQSAQGLQHAHETAGLVHRDIKPGNILIDRGGCVKVLDMGLARFFHDEEDILTKKYDENVLGTADYLAPEQALDSHAVDIRADIYSLGATYYFCLTGRTPFTEGTVAQKLIWHQTRQPKPIRQSRPEVPEGLIAIIDRMMAKDPAHRFQTPNEVADALAPWTETPIGPPPEAEMPQLSPAALGLTPTDPNPSFSLPNFSSGSPSGGRKNWQVSSGSGTRPPSAPGDATDAHGPSPAPAAPRSAPAARATSRPVPTLPKPNPRPQVTAPRPAASPRGPVANPKSPPGDMETPGWDQITGSTPGAKAPRETTVETPARVAVPLARSASLSLPTTSIRAGGQRAWVLILGVVVAILLGTLVAFVAWRLVGPVAEPTSPEKPNPSRTFKVGPEATLHTVAEALKQVHSGDRIVIQGPTHEENLTVDGNDPKLKTITNITIEAENDGVIWKPRTKDPSFLIALTQVEGWRLRGFTLDGQDACRTAVLTLSGRCPGTVLEDVRIQGFAKTGILLMNCEGDGDRPVRVVRANIRARAKDGAESALVFDLNTRMATVKQNRHIAVEGCQFSGAYKARVVVRDPANTRNLDWSAVTDEQGTDIPHPVR